MPGFNKDVGVWDVRRSKPALYPYSSALSGGNQFGAAMTRDGSQAVCTGFVQRPDGWLELRMFRTEGSWLDLVMKNDSVVDIGPVMPDGWTWRWTGSDYGDNNTVTSAVTNIDGTLYVSASGKGYLPTAKGYAGIWRDTSPEGDGSGPWVEHGVMWNNGLGEGNLTGANFRVGAMPGHITVSPNGTWLTPAMSIQAFGTTASAIRPRLYRSFDAGVTWTNIINNGHYIVGGIYGDNSPPQVAISPASGAGYFGSTGQGNNYYQSIDDWGAGAVVNWGGDGPWPFFGDQEYAYYITGGGLARVPWTGVIPERMTGGTMVASGLGHIWSAKANHASVLGGSDGWPEIIVLCCGDRLLPLIDIPEWQIGAASFGADYA